MLTMWESHPVRSQDPSLTARKITTRLAVVFPGILVEIAYAFYRKPKSREGLLMRNVLMPGRSLG